jgi:hypothetical protein
VLSLGDDPVARLYRERSEHFLETPPPDEWDRVFVMREK